MTRRDFNRRAATAAAGMLLAGTAGMAAPEPDPARAAPEVPAKPDDPNAKKAAAPETPGLNEAIALALLAAPHLPAADRTELTGQVKGVLDLVKDLRSHKVPDGTEPGFVFRALLPEAAPARKAAPAAERKARRAR